MDEITETTLSPGRELDLLVVERVMGWKAALIPVEQVWLTENWNDASDRMVEAWFCDFDHDNGRRCLGVLDEIREEKGFGGYNHFLLPNYSIDLSAAWQVVEKLTSEKDVLFQLEVFGGGCTASFRKSFVFQIAEHQDNAPHAICLAALKVVERPEFKENYAPDVSWANAVIRSEGVRIAGNYTLGGTDELRKRVAELEAEKAKVQNDIYWKTVERASKIVEQWPDWMKGSAPKVVTPEEEE